MSAVRPTWGEVFDAPPGTTGDDLLRLPDDGYKYELFEGMLVREMTSPDHGEVCQRLGVELWESTPEPRDSPIALCRTRSSI